MKLTYFPDCFLIKNVRHKREKKMDKPQRKKKDKKKSISSTLTTPVSTGILKSCFANGGSSWKALKEKDKYKEKDKEKKKEKEKRKGHKRDKKGANSSYGSILPPLSSSSTSSPISTAPITPAKSRKSVTFEDDY